MLQVKVSNQQQQTTFTHPGGPLEFGRGPRGSVERFVVADRYVSRDQLRIEPLDDGRLRIENLGAPVKLGDGRLLSGGQAVEVLLPVTITAGYTEVAISPPMRQVADQSPLKTLAEPRARQPGQSVFRLPAIPETPAADMLAQWFETLLTVQRAVAGTDEFYQQTAQAVVDLIGLDRGLVLLRDGVEWKVAACHVASDELSANYSRSILHRVQQQGRTFFEDLEDGEWAESLANVEAVVASPIFDREEQTIGVVYGSRDLRTARARRGISRLEAQLVQVLAAAVSAGLARVQREAEAARMRVQFESFFSPELVSELERNPRMLEGHQREVTVLFADLRGFSTISERLPPRETYALLSDVMDRLTQCILDHSGVMVDYHGDGLAAMWNAPLDQADHAWLACEAGWDMLGSLPALNEVWEARLGAPLRIGVGINTGSAQVGNAGSRRRLKYGPRGHAVNLASRVEGATKHFGVPLLATQWTVELLPQDVFRRRLCRVQVKGIADAVDLFEVRPEARPGYAAACRRYEASLQLFEQGQHAQALQELERLRAGEDLQDDYPARLLAEHAAAALHHPGEGQQGIFVLDSK